MSGEPDLLRRRLEREKLIRRQAEKIAEDKSRELYLKGAEREKALASERRAKQGGRNRVVSSPD